MTGQGQARLSQLDNIVSQAHADLEVARQLFEVADTVASNAGLRRMFTDYTITDEIRKELAAKLLADKVMQPVLSVVQEAVAIRWKATSDLVAALARQGARLCLMLAQYQGQLDNLEAELFQIARLLHDNPELAVNLNNQNLALADREALLRKIFAEKISELSLILTKRALTCRERTVELTLESYLQIAARLRERAIVRVTAARPLSIVHQDRLKVAMAKELGQDVTLQIVVDPQILGGLRVRVADDVIEGTVARRMQLATKLMD